MKKTLTSLLVLAGLIQLTGCSTPAYSARERANLIGRNIALEWQMMQDDIDRTLMLRPMTTLTKWHVTP
jgi:hypothetical protein